MATAAEILEWVKDFFDKGKLRYELQEERCTIKFVMPIDGKLKQTNIFINCRDDSFSVNAYVVLNAEEDARQRVSEYLMRANYGLRFGCFDMDFSDGEIRYSLTLDCEDRESLSESLIRKTIYVPVMMLERYGKGLIAVMYGIATPEEAVKKMEEEQSES